MGRDNVENVIDVKLYGGKSIFGGRERPLEAEIVKCDVANVCSFYEQGQCAKIYNLASGGCAFGTIEREKGYTTRSRKYSEFKDKWKSHPKYNNLVESTKKLGLIDDMVYFDYSYIRISEGEEEGEYILEGPQTRFQDEVSYIPLEYFTVDLIKRIVEYKPQAVVGGTITDYEEKEVPVFLSHLEEILPELYEEYRERYPEDLDDINYVGRKAYVKTLEPTTLEYRSSQYPEFNNEWYWDGEYLEYQEGYVSSFDIVRDYEEVEIRIKPKDDTVVEITDNSQVSSGTKFKD